jgi:hypothetical protein
MHPGFTPNDPFTRQFPFAGLSLIMLGEEAP